MGGLVIGQDGRVEVPPRSTALPSDGFHRESTDQSPSSNAGAGALPSERVVAVEFPPSRGTLDLAPDLDEFCALLSARSVVFVLIETNAWR